MEIIRLIPNEQGVVDWPTLSDDKRAVVTIGNFDGVHRGHQAVLEKTLDLAKKHDVPSVVITFDPQPGLVHRYASAHEGQELPDEKALDNPYELMGLNQKLSIIEKMGFDYAIVVRYTLAFAARTYIFFLGQLVGKLGMRTLVLGSDATMGKGREGDIKSITKLSQATGVFELIVVDDFGPSGIYVPREVTYVVPEISGEPVNPLKAMTKAELRAWSKKNRSVPTREYSSSMVRFLLARGCVKDAGEILGRAHNIEAVIVHGQARGRELGFPTANCGQIQGFAPVDGVYAGHLTVTETGEQYSAAISVGTNETFDGTERTVEAYCIDAPENLNIYGQKVRIEFTHYLRPMIKFKSVDELIEQMKKDVDEVQVTNTR
ncbi:bifunctional riboflavin kinase/FMN adenylyltransferase [Alloscardovia theropitheci]|uniref:Bifunctional riboflavin kinase/FMN adenylyltransferase n=1 Tax=Alloscardovia theropitheci TaxID=2496842 RepID=A0A4R0QWU6_9BIFI|nr:bifunctional riboflavin kinase/FMN adenylyltransferase [Alloscardovia theropitheci]TCD54937.1 bifunctional riboflavin kinase/FMN adenylyltransferase [Alloscardovia theropitheci]